MVAFFSWLVTGLIVGLVARALLPGRQAMGIANTIIIGIAGAVIGGIVSSFIWPVWAEDASVDRMWPGWLMSVAFAVLILWAFTTYTGRRNARLPG